MPALAHLPPVLLALGPLDPAVVAGAVLLLLVALAVVIRQLQRMAADRRAATEGARGGTRGAATSSTRSGKGPAAEGAARPTPSPGHRPPAELVSAAEHAAERGDHDRAVRLVWEGLVAALERGQLLAPRPDADPRTVLIAFKGSPHGRELLETVVGQVEAVCLRGQPADGHRYQLVREAAAQIAASEGAFLS